MLHFYFFHGGNFGELYWIQYKSQLDPEHYTKISTKIHIITTTPNQKKLGQYGKRK